MTVRHHLVHLFLSLSARDLFCVNYAAVAFGTFSRAAQAQLPSRLITERRASIIVGSSGQ